MSAVEAPTRSRTDTAAKSMAVLRIATGLLFLRAFADKAFGLGYATQSKNAWFSGGSPTKGFLSRVDVGPFESTFHAWAGTWWADLLFMAGLFAIGVAVTLGIGLRISAAAGAVMMLLSLDRHPMDGLPEQGQPADLPLAWAKPYGGGRVFYTALGHRDDVWRNAMFRQHVLGGLLWVLGLR